MKDSHPEAGEADLERLAARLAMLAAEDGEADNAGRAVGAMARRLGLTGGDLKRIFLAGAAATHAGTAEHHPVLEAARLREKVQELEADGRRAVWERDVLRAENGRLMASLERLRAGLRHTAIGAGGLLVVLLFAGTMAWLGHAGKPARAPDPAVAAEQQPGPVHRNAVVRPGGALLFGGPERSGNPLATLPAGLRLQVRRLVWKSLIQWAEVALPDGRSGYVLTTEIDLS